MSNAVHPMRVVVERTGLSPHVIRVWQKRYGAVEPDRTETNRRRYSEAEIERLTLLKELTSAGQSIGYIARLPTEELRDMRDRGRNAAKPATPRGDGDFVVQCLAAIAAMDGRRLEETLTEAETALGTMGLLQRVAAPLARAVGDQWEKGIITAAHEHFASAVLRTFLSQARPFAGSAGDPVLVVATPSGQLHELGALLVAAVAANVGWNVTYLGASLPVAEIAGAVRQHNARAVALSIVYPPDDPRLEGELTRLQGLIGSDVALLVGGRAGARYQKVVARPGVPQPSELADLPAALEALRKAGG